MANVDYVTVGAGPSRVDVAEAVKADNSREILASRIMTRR
jgi:hypothetical protein